MQAAVLPSALQDQGYMDAYGRHWHAGTQCRIPNTDVRQLWCQQDHQHLDTQPLIPHTDNPLWRRKKRSSSRLLLRPSWSSSACTPPSWKPPGCSWPTCSSAAVRLPVRPSSARLPSEARQMWPSRNARSESRPSPNNADYSHTVVLELLYPTTADTAIVGLCHISQQCSLANLRLMTCCTTLLAACCRYSTPPASDPVHASVFLLRHRSHVVMSGGVSFAMSLCALLHGGMMHPHGVQGSGHLAVIHHNQGLTCAPDVLLP